MTDIIQEQETEVTETSQSNSSDSKGNGFSQDDVNKIVADRVSRERKKFDGIDVDKYNQWQKAEDSRKVDEATKRGEFEEILKSQADKLNGRINELESTLKREKVDGALLGAASRLKSVAPDQVVDLLKNQIRLNESGEAEVVDLNGTPAYKDDGSSMAVNDLVQDFLTKNPHFAAPSKSGSGAVANVGGGTNSKEFDVSKLDMSDSKDRAAYAQYRKDKGY